MDLSSDLNWEIKIPWMKSVFVGEGRRLTLYGKIVIFKSLISSMKTDIL